MAIDPSPSNNGDGTSEAAVQESPSLCSSKRKRDEMDEGWNGNGDGDDASPADPPDGSTATGGATSGKKATGKGRRGRGSKKGRKGLKDPAERASKERELFNVYQAAMKVRSRYPLALQTVHTTIPVILFPSPCMCCVVQLPSLVDMIDFEASKCPKRSGRTEVDTGTTVTTVGTVPRDVIISSLSEGTYTAPRASIHNPHTHTHTLSFPHCRRECSCRWPRDGASGQREVVAQVPDGDAQVRAGGRAGRQQQQEQDSVLTEGLPWWWWWCVHRDSSSTDFSVYGRTIVSIHSLSGWSGVCACVCLYTNTTGIDGWMDGDTHRDGLGERSVCCEFSYRQVV